MPLPATGMDVPLATLRQPGAVLPPPGLMMRNPVTLPVLPALRLSELGVQGLRLAVDLDDTLLHGSQTCPSLWHLGGYQDPRIGDGYAYDRMRKGLFGHLRRLRGRARYDTIDRKRHDFMAAPRVIVAPNLMLLAILSALRDAGAQLVLATASARVRVTLLMERLPVLRDLFGEAVLCAEDLATRALLAGQRADDADDRLWAISAAMHRARPNSILLKTPWALSPAFGGTAFDLLIDDAPLLADLFSQHGLADWLLHIPGDAIGPERNHAVTMQVLTRIATMTGGDMPGDIGNQLASGPLADTVIRFEDPLYWPCLHVTDQLVP